MQRLMKCCARGALGLGAAALLLAGVPAQAGSSAGAPAMEPRLMAQSTAQPEEAEKLEKRRLEEQRKKMEQQQQQEKQQQGTQPKQMRTRGAVPEAAPAPEATPAKPGGKRFGAGVVRHGDPGDTGEVE
jgi:acetyl-CoA carboxylase carboxyltransferase component